MRSGLIVLLISLAFFLGGLYLITYPITRVTGYFAKHGKLAKANVESTSIKSHTWKYKRSGKTAKREKQYILFVSYKGEPTRSSPVLKLKIGKWDMSKLSKRWTMSQYKYIRHLISKEAFELAKQTKRVDVLYLKKADQKKSMPSVLLRSSVEASYFFYFGQMMKGDLAKNGGVWGVLLSIISLIGLIAGAVMLQGGRSKISRPTVDSPQ